MSTDRPPIGLKIKRARERQKPRMTQEQLAELIDVSQKTVDNWENGRSYPRSSIGALEEILGPLTDDTQPPAPGADVPEWVAGDPFLEHIYSYDGTSAEAETEKLVAARAVLTHREVTGGAHRVPEHKRA